MQNKSFGDLPPDKVVFAHTYGDIVGGVTIASADFNEGDIVPIGSLIGRDSNGLYHVIKVATLQANATNVATTYNVLKGHPYKVGDVIALATGGKASAITAINTSNANYDVITVSATLGAAATAGDGLFEAAVATAGTDSAVKYVPSAVTARSIQISKNDTNTVGAWTRADLYASRAPVAAASLKALVPQLQYVTYN